MRRFTAFWGATAFVVVFGCARSPEQLLETARAAAAAGRAADCVDACDKVLAGPGRLRDDALEVKASALFDLRRFEEAARAASEAAKDRSADAARRDWTLALKAYAASGDSQGGALALAALGGVQALSDPELAAAAAKLGIQATGTPGPAPKAVFDPSKLDAVGLAIASVRKTARLEDGFPVKTSIRELRRRMRLVSPDSTRFVWKDKVSSGDWLFLGGEKGQAARRIPLSRDAFQANWSPDSKRLLFSAALGDSGERSLFVFDVATSKSRRVFNGGRKIGLLAAWTPDGGKILFSFHGDLWLMNANGIGRTMLNLAGRIGEPVRDAEEIDFSGDGRVFAYRMKESPEFYVVELEAR